MCSSDLVFPIFSEDDLTIVNLEGPLTNRGKKADKEFAIRGDPAYVQILTSGSVEAVNLANNHTYDYGQAGYDQTIEVLSSAGIDYFGNGKIAYKQVKDVKVAMIGMSGWYNNAANRNSLTQAIQQAKAQADLVVVMFHWGVERENYANNQQQGLAYHAIDTGADLVVGSHPHVIQGIETYKGKHIVYSLGNFSFGANRNPDDKDTFIFQQTFKLTEDGIESIGSQVIPCSISSVTDRNNYQPRPLEGAEGERVMNRLITYSKNFSQSYFRP